MADLRHRHAEPEADGAAALLPVAGGPRGNHASLFQQSFSRQIAPQLLDQLGIGPVVAGQIIASWSPYGCVRSEAAFAKLGGAAPIEASSGTITRHGLNRWGDRQLNRALHTIVLVRMRQDLATKAYLQRRLAEGKTVRDIKRCLKRSIARQLFRQLELVPRPLDGT